MIVDQIMLPYRILTTNRVTDEKRIKPIGLSMGRDGLSYHIVRMLGEYDLVIIGGGISGASLLYTASQFTDIDRIALVEKEDEIAAINSHHTNNSQTLHFGDIETNYTLEKAEEVKEGAEMLAGYLENVDPDREMHAKRSKMVLAVGEKEVEKLEHRYHEDGFGELFPKLDAIGREEITELEPKVVEGRDPSKGHYRRLTDTLLITVRRQNPSSRMRRTEMALTYSLGQLLKTSSRQTMATSSTLTMDGLKRRQPL